MTRPDTTPVAGDAPTPDRSTQSSTSWRGHMLRAWSALCERPLLVTFCLALGVRLLAATVIALGQDGFLIPDERQYVELAASVARGDGADAWSPGYGQLLYETTRPFTGTLALLFQAFGPERYLGQLLAGLAGAAAATATAGLAGMVVRRPYALAVGVTAAVFPSQVLWSSVVLRESMVWLALVLMAVGLATAARRADVPGVVLGLTVFGASFYALGQLRGQTVVVAAWAAGLAVCCYSAARWAWAQRVAVLCGVLVIPYLVGLGLGGLALVERAVPQLSMIRSNLAVDADSAFVEVPTPRVVPPVSPAPTDPGPTPPPAAPQPPEDSALAGLGHVPTGLVAVLLRPFPGETARNATVALTQVENLAWYLLYALAAAGAWCGRHRRDVLAFSVLAAGGIVVSAALYQGNLGTSFRHRGQIFWALVVLSALAVQSWRDRRRDRPLDA